MCARDARAACGAPCASLRLVDVCYRKCVVKVKEEDLSVGEMSCCDRCVAKYLVRLAWAWVAFLLLQLCG